MTRSRRRDVHVSYCLTGSLDSRTLAHSVAMLSAEERARCERFRRPEDRRDFAVAHALLRRTLSRYEGIPEAAWVFTSNAFGKPSIAQTSDDPPGGRGVSFNIAHTDGLVACAVARDAELGVDVESVGRAVDGGDAVTRWFSPREAAALAACPAGEHKTRFVELWTLKEAYIKAVGLGLSHPLDTFAFEFDGPSHLRFEPPPDVDATAWQFALFVPSDDHRMAVAVKRAPGDARLITTWADDAGRARSCLLRESRA